MCVCEAVGLQNTPSPLRSALSLSLSALSFSTEEMTLQSPAPGWTVTLGRQDVWENQVIQRERGDERGERTKTGGNAAALPSVSSPISQR